MSDEARQATMDARALSMDEGMRRKHLERISFEGAAQMYDNLCQEYVEKNGGPIPESAQRQIGDCVRLEALKLVLYEDIIAKGIRETYRNGNQRGERPNKSVADYQRACKQQWSVLAALRLNPDSEPPARDGFDDI